MKKAKPRHVDAMLDSAMGKGKAAVDPLTAKFKNEVKEEKYAKGNKMFDTEKYDHGDPTTIEVGVNGSRTVEGWVEIGETDEGHVVQRYLSKKHQPKFVIRDDVQDLEVE